MPNNKLLLIKPPPSGAWVANREVLNELSSYNDQDFIQQWAKENKAIFLTPTNKEMEFVNKIFQVAHFRSMISRQSILKGTPVADPFVIASAYVRNGCVVTEEEKKLNAAKIPNVCEYFGVKCLNLEGLMGKEGWEF